MYANLPQHRLTTYDYFCGSSDIRDVTGAGFVDAGMLYDLKHDRKLYMGAFFSYTFTNLAEKNDDPLFNGKKYVGVVSSDNVDKTHLMSVGLKLGITFGRPRRKDTVRVDTILTVLQQVDTVVLQPDTAVVKPVTVESKPDTVVVKEVVVDSAAIKLAEQQKRQLDSMRVAEEQARMERERMEREQAELKTKQERELAERERIEQELKWLNTNLKVNFDKGKAVVEENEENNKHIAVLVEYIQNHPDKSIIVTGHTCNLGKEVNNVKLGLKRAEAMKQKLMEAGIPATNIGTQSMGSKQPLVPNTTEANRRINRRVELTIN